MGDEFATKEMTGMRLHFFSQKMVQKENGKKMPSTAVKAIMRLTNKELLGSHHWRAN
jgi:hypothetical protein